MHSPFERQNARQMRQDRRQDWLNTWEPIAFLALLTTVILVSVALAHWGLSAALAP